MNCVLLPLVIFCSFLKAKFHYYASWFKDGSNQIA